MTYYPLRDIHCRVCGTFLMQVRHIQRTKTLCKDCVKVQKKIANDKYLAKKKLEGANRRVMQVHN